MPRRYYRRRNRRSPSDIEGLVLVVFFIVVVTLSRKGWLYDALYMIIGIAVAAGLALIYMTARNAKRRNRLVALNEVDVMDGLEFERYVAVLLKKHGFHHVSLTEKYDMGVDIIAERDGQRWGIQVKRYAGLVKAEAVRQVVTGLRTYHCDKAMVITNSRFSNVAIRLAQSNQCVLVGRVELAKMISDVEQA